MLCKKILPRSAEDWELLDRMLCSVNSIYDFIHALLGLQLRQSLGRRPGELFQLLQCGSREVPGCAKVVGAAIARLGSARIKVGTAGPAWEAASRS